MYLVSVLSVLLVLLVFSLSLSKGQGQASSAASLRMKPGGDRGVPNNAHLALVYIGHLSR